MKQILCLVLALALTAALFTGCGCAANVSTHPGGMITEESTRPSVMPMPTATQETTRPPETTRPHATLPTETGTDATGESPVPEPETTLPSDTTTEQRGRNRNTDR